LYLFFQQLFFRFYLYLVFHQLLVRCSFASCFSTSSTIHPVLSFSSSFSIFLSLPLSSFYPDPNKYAFSTSPLFSLSNFSEFNQQNYKYLLNKAGLRSPNVNTRRCINSLTWTHTEFTRHTMRGWSAWKSTDVPLTLRLIVD
jgi:hypothetical protein